MNFIQKPDETPVHIAKNNTETFCGITNQNFRPVSEEELRKTTRNCCKCWQAYLDENPS